MRTQVPRTAEPESTFGGMLRGIRERQSIKLRELARRTHYSHSYLSKVENGVKPPTIELATQCDTALAADGALVEAARTFIAVGEGVGCRPVQLPAGLSRFVGRDDEIALLSARLADGSGSVLVIDGPAGVGKSALAVQWAHRVLPRFEDGVLFADLHGFSGQRGPEKSGDVLWAFLSALGVPAGSIPVAVDHRAGLFRSMLYDRKMLVILDNAADYGQVRPLLPNSPTCATLVTSRRRLSGLSVVHDAVTCALETLSPQAAGALVRGTLGLQGTDGAAVEKLTRHCGHLPLALRLAAERVAASGNTSVAEATETFIAHGDRLDPLDAGDDPMSIRTVLSWSYRTLEAPAARVFRLLSLSPTPTLTTQDVAALAGVTAERAHRLLTGLVELRLVEQTSADHYRQHDLVRCYAAELATESETEAERAQAVRRLREHGGSSQESPRHHWCSVS